MVYGPPDQAMCGIAGILGRDSVVVQPALGTCVLARNPFGLHRVIR
jgi:hypothetical protein